MSSSVIVVGLPSAADCAPDKTWRAAADFVETRLRARFGSEVALEYLELFGPEMAHHPEIEASITAGEAVPPIVVIDGVRHSAGGKLHVSSIERAVADALANDPSNAHGKEPRS